MDEGAFDIIILGTGLTQSIAAAALAKAGFKVAHIDHNPYYGADEASLSFEELIQWQNASAHFSRSGDTISQPRSYSLSLSPSLIPSTGPLIAALVASGVSRYGGFRLIERVCVYHSSGTVKSVPGSKEDVFKNKDISLLDKRRLMRFLMFAAGDFEDKKELEGHTGTPFPHFLKSVFSLNDEMISAIAYALAYCLSPTDPTLPALHRLRRYLRSAGRYGASPFLVGHYGSSGEIAQGFCRTAAVSGAVYILGRAIESISTSPSSSASSSPTHTLRLADFPDPLTCSLLISSPSYPHSPSGATAVPLPPSPSAPFSAASPTYAVARCIAIIDRPLSLGVPAPAAPSDEEPTPFEDAANDDASIPDPPPSSPALDAAVLVFPPSSLPTGTGSSNAAATVLVTGEGTMSDPLPRAPLVTPTDADAQTLLKPYLDATLALAEGDADTPLVPLFSSYYIQHTTVPPASSEGAEVGEQTGGGNAVAPHLLPSPLPPILPLPDAGDAAAVYAERVFSEAVRILRPSNPNPDANAAAEDEEGHREEEED
ncbi:GDP dissociation inhibitor-domain-containing protein [Mycena olivaceomarginata]|nr:GDP dissociation inhibitor-domain-containing protein [Mycena olivaceomarginata]